MKSLSTLLLLFVVVGLSNSMTVVKSPQTYFGSSSDWKNYAASVKGIYIDIDLSSLNLTNAPSVATYVTCNAKCWTSSGSTSIYNLTNKGFRVYLYKVNSMWTPT